MNIDNIKIILDHYLDNEIIDFNKRYSLLLKKMDDKILDKDTKLAIDQIEICMKTVHIAYNLLKLKLEMEEEIKRRENGKKISRSLNESHL